MKKLSIQLKSKHIDYLGNRLFEINRDVYDKLLKLTTVVLSGANYADNDFVSFDIEPELLTTIYQVVGAGTFEALASEIHRLIKEDLQPQIATLCLSSDSDIQVSALWVAGQLSSFSTGADDWVVNQMVQGHARLRL